MERTEANWTLVPFLVGAAVFSVLMSLGLGFRGPALAGMLAVFFVAGLVGLALVYVLFLLAVSAFLDRDKPQTRPNPFCSAMVIFVMGLVPAMFRVRIHAKGVETLPQEPWLLVGNHRSGFDPLVTGWVLRKRKVAFITKPGIQRLPIVGPFIHKSCFLGIDRDNDREALKTILAAIRLLKENACSVGIYPEGTRNTGEGLLPFRNGAFKIAQKAKAPIVVAALRGTDQIMKNFPWRPTDVYLEFRAVLDADHVAETNTGEIGEEIRKCILSANT